MWSSYIGRGGRYEDPSNDPRRSTTQGRSQRDSSRTRTAQPPNDETWDPSLQPVKRNNRYGKSGEKTLLDVNSYRVGFFKHEDAAKPEELYIVHYNLEFKKDQICENASRGHRRGRELFRGRGSNVNRESTNKKLKFDDKPPPLPLCVRLIKDVEIRNQSAFRGARVAHDGRKNVYTSSDPGWGAIELPGEVDDKQYMVRFSIVARISKVDIKALINQSTEHKTERGKDPSIQSWIQCLDTVARTSLMRNFTYAGKNFTYAPELATRRQLSVGGGCEAWPSFYASFKPMETGLYYSINVSYNCFYIQQTVRDFALQTLQKISIEPDAMEIEDPWPNGMSSFEISKLNNELRGLKIEPTYQTDGRARKPAPIKRISDRCALEIECEDRTGSKISIAQHFEEIGEKLKFPQLPCIDLQSGKHGHTFIPLEKALLCAAQLRRRQMPIDMHGRMIRLSASDPLRKSKDISSMFDKVNSKTAPLLQAFGIDVNCDMTPITGRILPPPFLFFRETKISVEDRVTNEFSWSTNGHKLSRTDGLDDWGLLITAGGFTKPQAKSFVLAFLQVAKELGMEIHDPVISFGFQQTVAADMIKLFTKVQAVSAARKGKNFQSEGKCRMIMVVKDDAGTTDYDQIKNCGETYLGIPTQCIVKHHAEEPRELYLRNVILKVNAKLGGVNWTTGFDSVECLVKRVGPSGKASTMIIGICVTHPPAMQSGGDRASVAAVVGSLDSLGNRWASSTRLCDATENGITTAPDMVFEVLWTYRKIHGMLPANLLIYRAGVSDGQFQHIKEKEVTGIRAKVTIMSHRHFNVEYNPRITFIVLQKKHHTRFFPAKGQRMDINRNCVPGTVVDRTIAHSVNYDFYLVSHNSCQGTARPVRYTLLEDDLNFYADEIQGLTFNMAFGFCRSTNPVASVPAVMYAELVSTRARCHLAARHFYKDMKKDKQHRFLNNIPDKLFEGLVIVPPCLREVLYYV